MKLSIIVPIYNLEKFITPCLESIVKISLPTDEYEIIAINDGSKDRSLEVAQKFALDYHNITVLTQDNVGVGAARNLGVKFAKGDYIWFVDGDDLINSDKAAAAVEEALAHNVDVLTFDFMAINEQGQEDNWTYFKMDMGGQPSLPAEEFYLSNFGKSYLWLFFFKRSIFTEKNLLFHDYIKMQDGEIMPKIMANCKTVRYFDEKLVRYRFRSNSAVNDKNENSRKMFYNSMVVVASSLAKQQEHIAENSVMHKALGLKRRQLNQMLFTNLMFNRYSKETNQEFIDLLVKHNHLPFKAISGFTPKMNFKLNVVRKLVNLNPKAGREIYQRLFK